jgi:hypothetical protein
VGSRVKIPPLQGRVGWGRSPTGSAFTGGIDAVHTVVAMALPAEVITVAGPAELDALVAAHAARGYELVARTPGSATLVKRKRFSLFWLVVGLVLCLVPLVAYLVVYAMQSDRVVRIVVAGSAEAGEATGGRWEWDGTAWRLL